MATIEILRESDYVTAEEAERLAAIAAEVFSDAASGTLDLFHDFGRAPRLVLAGYGPEAVVLDLPDTLFQADAEAQRTHLLNARNQHGLSTIEE